MILNVLCYSSVCLCRSLNLNQSVIYNLFRQQINAALGALVLRPLVIKICEQR